MNKLVIAVTALLLVGCSVSPEDQAKLDSVVTALPTEVAQCVFLGDVTNPYGSFSLEAARNILKLKVAELGGNTLVENNMAAMQPCPFFIATDCISCGMNPGVEFFLSGRAYSCPKGAGVLVRAKDGSVKPFSALASPAPTRLP